LVGLGVVAVAMPMLAAMRVPVAVAISLAMARIQRLQSHTSVKPWMFGFAEVKQSPHSRE